MAIEVIARDTENGETDTKTLPSGGYVVVCADPMYLAHEQVHKNGTVVLTLKRWREPSETQTGGTE